MLGTSESQLLLEINKHSISLLENEITQIKSKCNFHWERSDFKSGEVGTRHFKELNMCRNNLRSAKKYRNILAGISKNLKLELRSKNKTTVRDRGLLYPLHRNK